MEDFNFRCCINKPEREIIRSVFRRADIFRRKLQKSLTSFRVINQEILTDLLIKTELKQCRRNHEKHQQFYLSTTPEATSLKYYVN